MTEESDADDAVLQHKLPWLSKSNISLKIGGLFLTARISIHNLFCRSDQGQENT